jgi:preprotein translocase subunit YajC
MMSLQAAAPGRPQGVSFVTALIPFALVFVIFYLLIVMPQRNRQKKHMNMVEQLKPGDQIITSGGIYGTIMGVQPDRIELKVASNVKIDITKSAVAVIVKQQQPEIR